jgi:hypothetical protein
MNWKGFDINGLWKDLSHLRPLSVEVPIDDMNVTLRVTFGSHCFTDEKGSGPEILIPGQTRYWSEDRYQASFKLPDLIRNEFITSYAVAFRSWSGGEQYHYLAIHDYAIFFDINKPEIPDTLKIKVVSAYEMETWGSRPKGNAKKISWILSQRLQGKKVL